MQWEHTPGSASLRWPTVGGSHRSDATSKAWRRWRGNSYQTVFGSDATVASVESRHRCQKFLVIGVIAPPMPPWHRTGKQSDKSSLATDAPLSRWHRTDDFPPPVGHRSGSAVVGAQSKDPWKKMPPRQFIVPRELLFIRSQRALRSSHKQASKIRYRNKRQACA